jgi:hypothetical protein
MSEIVKKYRPVEIFQHSLCRCILDTIIKTKNG